MSAPSQPSMTLAEVARKIDHSALDPTVGHRQIRAACEEAMRLGTFAVCVNPDWVRLVQTELEHSNVVPCSVVGFPLGASRSDTKAREAAKAIEDGATELDMVLPLGRLKDGEYEHCRAHVAAVVQQAEERLVKVILETAALSVEEIQAGCRLAVDGGAQFVKTSTGFGPGGATVAAVRAMRTAVGPDIGVKASGGIRDARGARALLEAGADRLGTSSSASILTEWQERQASSPW